LSNDNRICPSPLFFFLNQQRFGFTQAYFYVTLTFMSVRGRYAPSPTGLQHVGGVRTALFNYLFARNTGGSFVLRLEDTDRARSEEGFVQNLYDTFKWLGFHWDEGPDLGGPFSPYIQSQRSSLYAEHARAIIEKGFAYHCFCSSKRIEEVRLAREAAKSSESGYDRFCRGISKDEALRRAANGEPCTIRLKIPLGKTTRFTDHLLGVIEWKNDDINPDPVLLKSDGFPTYHLANVIDDHFMKISHVLRAQEWLSSTPLHIILYESLGFGPPVFCHLPMVMGEDGKKLSKRHGSTSIDEFRKQGYLPEALVNYIALLGASYEEGRDIYTLKDLEKFFSIDKLNKAPAVFDYKKLAWFNGQYIRMKSDEELATLCIPYAKEAGLFVGNAENEGPNEPSKKERELFTRAMPLIRERINFLHEAAPKISYLFKEPSMPGPAEFIPKKSSLEDAVKLLRLCAVFTPFLANQEKDVTDDMTCDTLCEAIVTEHSEKNSVKKGDVMMILRIAVTGSRVSPPLFPSIRLLGVEKTLARINRAIDFLETEPNGLLA
jgi:glutamyl-tRNA synthetase